MVRKIAGIVLGLVLLFLAVTVAQSLISGNERPKVEVPQTVKTVFAEPVINSEIPVQVSASGNLIASKKIEIYSEVQGVLDVAGRPFKAGQSFKKGDLLLRMDSREFYTSLLAQRSSLYDQIASMMPDLKFDYPEAFDRWNKYLKAFDLERNVRKLPEPQSDKERFFITGNQIVTSYYTIKNLEERLSKYSIRAPFDGILTEALVNPGTLVRSGQKLGEYVSVEDFELEVAVNEEYIDILKVGKNVKLTDLSNSQEWLGKVRRVNGRLDQETQTVKVFIGVQGESLIEGMYLEANIAAKSIPNAVEIQRSLLINEKELFVVKDDKLAIQQITPVFYTEKTAVVKGLPNGVQMINRPVAGGYPGMPVKIASNVAITTP